MSALALETLKGVLIEELFNPPGCGILWEEVWSQKRYEVKAVGDPPPPTHIHKGDWSSVWTGGWYFSVGQGKGGTYSLTPPSDVSSGLYQEYL